MSQDISIIRYTELPQKGAFRQQKVEFTLGKRSNKVTGILKLVQTVVKLLLTTPGTDHFAPDTGTIIPGLVRRGVAKSSVQLVKMNITVSIQDLERQIQDLQASQILPDDERLASIEIRRVEFLDVSTEWIIEISVLSEAGIGVAFDISPFLKGK